MPDHANSLVVLRLNVNNHPGVMSHVCGLFARRAFNLEGIVVTPVNGGETCAMWLMIKEDERMEQVLRQVRKLRDVLDVRVGNVDSGVFERLAGCLRGDDTTRSK